MATFLALPQELRDAIYEFCTPSDRMFFISHILDFPKNGRATLKWGSIFYPVATPEYDKTRNFWNRRHDAHALARVCKRVYAEYGETQRRLENATYIINIPAPIYGHVKGRSDIAYAFGFYNFPMNWDVTSLVVRLDYSK